MDRPGTVIARHDPSELVTSVGGDGEVLVQGLRAGVLDGLPLPARPRGARGLARRSSPPRTARSAGLVRERVEALEREEDAAFALGPGAEVLWRGAAVARLVAGESRARSRRWTCSRATSSTRRCASACGGASPAGSSRTCARRSRPLFALRERRARRALVRGLAFALVEGLGAVSRRSVAQQVAALTPDDRRALSRLGVTVGRLRVFLPALLRPEALRLRARLFAVRQGRPAESGPDGAPSVAVRPAPPAGLLPRLRLPARRPARRPARPAGARGGRRLAPLARRGRSSPRGTSRRILGCPADELPAVLSAIGYVEKDGRFERRARRGGQVSHPRPRSIYPRASHACHY